MTVGELIRRLQTVSPETPVVVLADAYLALSRVVLAPNPNGDIKDRVCLITRELD